MGEITPLPGYSHETVRSIAADLGRMAERVRRGEPISEVLTSMKRSSPFVASGVQCALETCGPHALSLAAVDGCGMRLAALCDGSDAASVRARAAVLQEKGFTTLKMKVGKLPVADELERLGAAHAALREGGLLRLDANQAYGYDDAARLCEGLAAMERVELFEQPFKPKDWKGTRRLTMGTAVPIMLDEAIWSSADVEAAAQSGASWVKFKLCKHFGIQESLDLIAQAEGLGLGTVYGNGVQSALGNHLEAYVYGRSGLQAASESNGFLKVSSCPFGSEMTVRDGVVIHSEIDVDGLLALEGEEVVDMAFKN